MNGVMPTVFRYKLEIRSIGWKETVDYLTTIYSAYTSIIITYLMYICADYIYTFTGLTCTYGSREQPQPD